MEPTTARTGDGRPKGPAPGTAELVFPMEARVADEWAPVTVRATYRSSAPYEVALEFLTDGESLGRWVFARDLLTQGSVRAAGIGDVRVWTAAVPDGGPERVHLFLDNGSEHCLFVADRHHIALWCAVMSTLVPPGTEPRHMDVDGLLHRLLTG